ncbi:hypothetical protein AWG56_00040 [Escherichia coli]|nr:hypothetical protein AWG56_00040 [Escherichia coli]
MTSLKTSIKTITYLSDTGCLEIQGASLLSLLGQRLLRSDVLFFMASQQVVSGALPVSLST